MKLLLAALLCFPAAANAADLGPGENSRWQQHAAHVHIIRDNWGIAHVYGKSDADAVFGMIYAQAEDDFNRVERNYLNGLGWLAQAEGESAVYSDLRERLFIDAGRLAAAIPAAPRVAEDVDGCLVRRPELLPVETSRTSTRKSFAISSLGWPYLSPKAASAAILSPSI